MQHHVLRGTAIAIALAAAFGVQAADEEAIIVTATRSPTRASALISDFSVITHEQIEQAPQSSLGELLQAQPGVQLSTNGGAGTPTAVGIRGGSSAQTLILVDGQRVSSATQGTTALEHIPLNQIDHVEILRGPASSLYGADAVAGVIQVFTRQGEGKPRATVEAGVGSYRTAIGSVNYGGRVNDTAFNLNAGVVDSGSFSATKPGAFGFNPDRDPYNNANVSAQLAQHLNADHELGARLLHSQGKTHFDAANCDATFTTCTNDFNNYQKQALDSVFAYSRNRFTRDWVSELRLGRSQDSLTSHFLDPVTNSVNGQRFTTRQDQLTWQNDLATRLGRLLLAGERRTEHVDSNTVEFTAKERTTDSFVGGYRGSFGSHTLQISARRDRNSQFGTNNTGTLGYGYQLTPAWRASASLGTAYRAPTFNDMFWPVDFSSFYVGNPNLRPERAHNREAGVVYEARGQRVSVTAYRNRVSDLITFGNAAAPAFFLTTVNVGTAELKGMTATYDGRFGSFTARASYDGLSAKDADTGKYLIRRARETGSGEIRYHRDRWNSGLQVVASGPRYVDTANTQQTGGFTLVNVDARYTVSPHWSVIGRLNNLFDRKYELVQGFNTPGANVFVGLRYVAN